MGLRSRLVEFTSPEEVKEFMGQHPTCAIFKAGGCHKTMQGFGYVEEALNDRDHIPMGFVRVIENRPASNYIAEVTGITHESPQLILIVDGEVVFDVDNWDITPEILQNTLNEHFGLVEGGQKPVAVSQENMDRYIRLLSQFVEGEISQEDFEKEWLTTFQCDSSLRSTEEFNLLNSLFGDVDQALANQQSAADFLQIKTCQNHNPLKAKAKQILQHLEAIR